MEKYWCDICGKYEAANNAEPIVKGGKCCDECNSMYVIPARIKEIFENRRAKQENK